MPASDKLIVRPMGEWATALQNIGERMFVAPKDTIRDIDSDAWSSPLQPVQPFGGPKAEPQAFQLWAGQNLIYTPRPDAVYSAADLKAYASYPLLRILIENIKDILTSASWEIQLKRQPGESKKDLAARAKGDKNLLALNKFFLETPDREHDFADWLRLLVEDMLVIDAACVLIRKRKNGEIAELPPIRGEMITRYVDRNGWTPLPPDPAYAQLWWGIPRVDLTTEQIVYRPRNIVPRNTLASQMYGMSPTEQLAPEVEIGIQRLAFVLAYYTEGSIPGIVQVVPKGVSTKMIEEAMAWMNSDLAGQLAKRRQWRLVQGWTDNPKDENIQSMKEALLTDPYDEMHMRRLAFGIGVSPQRLLKAMNRASAEQSDDAAEIEGSRPYFRWAVSLINSLIQRFGYGDYEMVVDAAKEPDAKKQMEVITGYVKGCVLTPNQGREKLGEEADPDPAANELGTITANGWTPMSQSQEAHESAMGVQAASAEAARNPKPPAEGEGTTAAGGKPNGKPKPAAGAGAKAMGFAGGAAVAEPERGFADVSKVKPAHHAPHGKVRAVIHPGRMEPQTIVAKHRMEKILKDRFARMSRIAVREMRKAVGIATKSRRAKATIMKADRDDAKTLQAIIDAFQKEWRTIAEEVRQSFEDAASAGAMLGAMQLDITDEDLLAKIDSMGAQWAAERAAELVGMKQVDGELIDNPDARWAISETTRDKIRNVITDVFEQEAPTLGDIESAVEDAGIFDDQRATMIARTEVSRAQNLTNLMSWRESGLVLKVDWQLSSEHDGDDECDDNEDDSPYDVDDVPEFPAHPNCMCSLVLNQLAGEPDEGGDE